MRDIAARPLRAVVLAENPVAPYSRALRMARALHAEGFAVEIAATARLGLETEEITPDYVLHRYSPGLEGGGGGRRIDRVAPTGVARLTSSLKRAVRWPYRVRKAMDWPQPLVREWWSSLDRDLAPADLYHCCGVFTLPPALAAKRRAEAAGKHVVVIYDMIDDYFDSVAVASMPRPARWRLRRAEGERAGQADAVVTPNRGLAEPVARRWGLPAPIQVIDNFPDLRPYEAAAATPAAGGADDPIRAATGLPADARIVLYQGRLGPGRCLDESAAAVLGIPGAVFVVVGFGPWYDLCVRRDTEPEYRGRHFTLPAVHPDDLARWTRVADVSLVVLEDGPANFRLTTPNKLWESAGVGVPVVVSASSTVMRDLVKQYDLGAVARSASTEDIRTAIRSILDRPDAERAAWRARIAALAATEFSWPAAEAEYRHLVRKLAKIP